MEETKNSSFMKKNRKNGELQSRREFFKKAAKSALPILSTMLFAFTPTLIKAKTPTPMDCMFGCSGMCLNMCTTSCTGNCMGWCSGCTAQCSDNCTGWCKGGCSGSCSGSCSSSCTDSSK